MADGETEFQTAYQVFQAEKQEARRLQGLVATLTAERADDEAGVAEEMSLFSLLNDDLRQQ